MRKRKMEERASELSEEIIIRGVFRVVNDCIAQNTVYTYTYSVHGLNNNRDAVDMVYGDSSSVDIYVRGEKNEPISN